MLIEVTNTSKRSEIYNAKNPNDAIEMALENKLIRSISNAKTVIIKTKLDVDSNIRGLVITKKGEIATRNCKDVYIQHINKPEKIKENKFLNFIKRLW